MSIWAMLWRARRAVFLRHLVLRGLLGGLLLFLLARLLPLAEIRPRSAFFVFRVLGARLGGGRCGCCGRAGRRSVFTVLALEPDGQGVCKYTGLCRSHPRTC
jgi:hypothetical protein